MSFRIAKINELIRQELSKIIQEEIRTEDQAPIICVQEVQTADDLKTAKVWVSIFGQEITQKEKDNFLHRFQKQAFNFQKQLGRKLDLKFIPKLVFKLDISGEVQQKIDKLLEEQ